MKQGFWQGYWIYSHIDTLHLWILDFLLATVLGEIHRLLQVSQSGTLSFPHEVAYIAVPGV